MGRTERRIWWGDEQKEECDVVTNRKENVMGGQTEQKAEGERSERDKQRADIGGRPNRNRTMKISVCTSLGICLTFCP